MKRLTCRQRTSKYNDYKLLNYTVATKPLSSRFRPRCVPFATKWQLHLFPTISPLFQNESVKLTQEKVRNDAKLCQQLNLGFYDQILDIHFFTFSYTIGLSQISCKISIYYEHYNARFLDLYFREVSAAINFPCSNSWLKIGINDVIFSKIPHGLKLS